MFKIWNECLDCINNMSLCELRRSKDAFELTEEIVDWIARGSKVLPHFHIPLQSGCDTILSAMGRRYTTADFAAKIAYIRKRLEKEGRQKVFFGIDVIVGFPGETDEMFRTTYDFLANTIKPAFIHIFPYSRRPGTPAAGFPNQITRTVKTTRARQLTEAALAARQKFAQSFIGKTVELVIEDAQKVSGWTGEYLPCKIEGSVVPRKKLVRARVYNVKGDLLRAHLIKEK